MLETAIALVLFLCPLAYSPGPGNLFFAANGARFGLRATLRANAGYHLATWFVTLVIGLGLIAAMERYPTVFAVLKVAGALYVLWISWKLFRSGMLRSEEEARPAGFTDGMVLLLLNPKAYVIIALMFTQFLIPGEQRWIMMVLMITTIFTLNNLVAFTIWTAAGDAIAHRFRSATSARRLNTGLSAILAGVGVWMLFS
jgi:threonine/homoserine/homoserine lactone efflux protein